MHTHDSGRYIQPYGIAADNPALMRLARESFMFHQAHSAAPICSPSRTALLMGMYPHSCGMFGLSHRGFSPMDLDRHLSNYLHRNGYYTVLAGVQHEANHPELLGYDERHSSFERDTRVRDARALAAALDFYAATAAAINRFFSLSECPPPTCNTPRLRILKRILSPRRPPSSTPKKLATILQIT